MNLFLDANVLFTAAHNPQGKAALVVQLGQQGHWELAASRYALKEARRNLRTKSPESLDALESLPHGFRFVEHHASLAAPAALAKKDRPIFQAAVACRATHLLTGDLKDFGSFMNRPEETFGILVQTVGTFLESLS